MQTYNVADIIRDVRILMDDSTQTSSDLAELGIESNLTYVETDNLIKRCIVEAIRTEYAMADISVIEGKEYTPTVQAGASGTGTLSLPEDYMRLVCVKMNGWKLPCTNIVLITDPKYVLQKNRYSRGNSTHPVLVKNGSVLEYYSVPAGTTAACEYFRYLPLPTISSSTVEIEPLLYNRIITRITALTLASLKDENASTFFELLK